MSKRNPAEEEQRILEVLSSQRFQQMKGLGHEVPFFIWAYPPEWELRAAAAADRIRTVLQTERGLTVVAIDLFDLAIGMLGERGVLDRLEALEPRRSKRDFQHDLQRMLDPEKHIAPAIRE